MRIPEKLLDISYKTISRLDLLIDLIDGLQIPEGDHSVIIVFSRECLTNGEFSRILNILVDREFKSNAKFKYGKLPNTVAMTTESSLSPLEPIQPSNGDYYEWTINTMTEINCLLKITSSERIVKFGVAKDSYMSIRNNNLGMNELRELVRILDRNIGYGRLHLPYSMLLDFELPTVGKISLNEFYRTQNGVNRLIDYGIDTITINDSDDILIN